MEAFNWKTLNNKKSAIAENASLKLSRKLSSRDMFLARLIAIAVACFTTLQLIWELYGLFHEYNKAIAAGAEVNLSMSLPWMFIRINLALILSAVGLYFRHVKGLLISMLALIWVGIEYLSWHIWSLRIKAMAGIGDFQSTTPYADNLYGATRWNIAVLVVVAAFFVWEVKIFVNLVQSCRKGFLKT